MKKTKKFLVGIAYAAVSPDQHPILDSALEVTKTQHLKRAANIAATLVIGFSAILYLRLRMRKVKS